MFHPINHPKRYVMHEYSIITTWHTILLAYEYKNVTDGFARLNVNSKKENDSLSGNTDQNEPMKQAEIAIADIQLAERNQL